MTGSISRARIGASRARRALVAFCAVAIVASTLALAPVLETAPAGAVVPARNGSTAELAAPSCWAIKQAYPSSADGTYWLWTPTLIAPEQFYCDMTTSGGGWVLVGRGREGWGFGHEGQGSPEELRTVITGTNAFTPDVLSTATVDGLLNGGRMDALTDGIRLRRATNTAGSSWQEARMRVKTYGSWSWALSGGIYLSSITFDGTTTNLATSTYRTNTTANTQVDNTFRRVNTVPQSSHSYRGGFAFGSSASNGSNAATSYLWEFANENNAIPFTQMFLRPMISETDIVNQGVSFASDTGLPGSTVRRMLDSRPTDESWGLTGRNDGVSIPSLRAGVLGFAEIGNTIYVGGKFLQVQHGPGGPTFNQPYLAAFDRDSGEWIPSFHPVLDAPVWELKASPDGTKLFVGGEFESVNGQANTTSLAALDPVTGAPVTSWVGYASRPNTTDYDVRAMDIQGPWLYIGGNFTRVSGGTGTQFQGPITDSRMARLRLTDGRPDGTWKPSLDTAPMDIDASDTGSRVYAVGLFKTLNNVTLNPSRLAIMDTATGAAVPGLQPFRPNATTTEWQNAILEVGNKVYQGGSQHMLHQYNQADYAFERAHLTRDGGDFQAIAYHDGIIYASCHCDQWQYEDDNTWPDPAGYSKVNAMKFIGAYDTSENLEVIPEFQPNPIDSFAGAGPWEMMFDSKGCMWAGGDLQRADAPTNTIYGGYERFCQRDAEAPVMTTASASVAGNDVTLTWPAPTDNSGGPFTYEVLKDDPTFGTIVLGTTNVRTFTDDAVVGNARYFVRAVDKAGNRSATTPVVSVTPPPPSAGTLLASGTSWSYRADGQDLGVAWRQPGYDASAWPTGASELGWGDGDEATVLAAAPVTHYFVKHVSVPSPGSFKTVTVRLKRDDGAAVYVNGVEVVRDNLPAGPLHATTPASSFVAGADEATWYEYQIPASLLVPGDNVIAAELHQGAANNADGTFNLELVARNGSETTPPSTPAPTVTPGFSTADLSWTASTDDAAVIGYIVKRNGAPVVFTTATSFTDTGLTPETAYSFDVVAVDSSGNASAPGTVGTTTGQNPTLARTGDVWSYRSGAPDASTTWKNPGYNVSSWATGPSQLGWGDGDEATVVPSGTLTQYYVRHFNVPNPEQFPTLRLRVLRDDGVAVYLNGVEVARDGLPAGTPLPTTFANQAINNAAENAYIEFTVPGSLLSTGDNVIAAEVHQNTNANADSSFDLQLDRLTPPENVPPSQPALSLTDRTEASITFGWTASTDNSGVLGYTVRRDGALVGYTSGTTFTDTGLAPSTAYSYQVVAIDTSGNASTPGSLAASTTVNPYLVNFGKVWKYRNDAVNQGTAWTAPAFDDSTWASGPSELGYGDNDEATTIGPITTPTPVTAYFRSTFNVTDPGTVTALTMDVVRDDGFVAYINGVEVGRQNMPAGTIAYTTRPVAGVADRSDETTPVTLTVPPSALIAGTNSIAVEMHQANASSNDLSFNLRLKATYGVVPVVTITGPSQGAFVTTSSTTIAGLCTTSAGTVTVNVGGTATSIVTAPCVANTWTVATPLADGTYTAVASQTEGTLTGSSPVRTFSVDTTGPVVTIDAPTEGALLGSTSPAVSGTCSTGDGNVTVAVTGASATQATAPCTTGTWSATLTGLITGSYSATAAQSDAAGNGGTSGARGFSVDADAPVTTDDSAAIGNAWRSSAATVTLSPTDLGSGVSQTYYTVDDSTPTTASATGTSISLTTEGVYTIKYFSTDVLGNSEGVKTAGTQIRIDQSVPTTATTFPGPSLYNATTWAAGCPVAGLCGTAADSLSGLASVNVTVQRQSDGFFWNGSAWQSGSVSLAATGTGSWNRPLAGTALTSGVSYLVSVTATDAAGNPSAPSTQTFTYDATGPTTASTASTNKNGAINANVDTFSVTFNEALDPTSVPTTATLTLRKSFLSNTTYAISGVTNGNLTTGNTGYLGTSISTLQVTYNGTVALSNGNKTVTFTVTGSCSGSCSSVSTTSRSGAYQFQGATTLKDIAGNAPTGTVTASSQVLF